MDTKDCKVSKFYQFCHETTSRVCVGRALLQNLWQTITIVTSHDCIVCCWPSEFRRSIQRKGRKSNFKSCTLAKPIEKIFWAIQQHSGDASPMTKTDLNGTENAAAGKRENLWVLEEISMHPVKPIIVRFSFVGVHPCVGIYAIYCLETMHSFSFCVRKVLKECLWNILADDKRATNAAESGS